MFYLVLFTTASIRGILISISKSIRPSKSQQFKNLIWGVIFGIPNFFSLVFFMQALEKIDNSIVFSLTSIGIVVSSSLLGKGIFQENISRKNWLGILISIIAIYLFY